MTFSLKDVQLDQIDKIVINTNTEEVHVKLLLELGPKGAGHHVKLEEVIPLGGEQGVLTMRYKRALYDFLMATQLILQDAEKPGEYRERMVKCGTCYGACCYVYDEVRLTPDDVEMLHQKFGAEWIEEHTYDKGPHPFTGHTRAMKYGDKPFTPNKEKACVMLTTTGCSIYENRPTVCREYSAVGCGDFDEDPTKVVLKKKGKTTLRVVT